MFKRIVLILSIISLGSHSIYSMNSSSSLSSSSSGVDSDNVKKINRILEDFKDVMVDPETSSAADKKKYYQYFSDLPTSLQDMVISLKKSHEFKKHMDSQEH